MAINYEVSHTTQKNPPIIDPKWLKVIFTLTDHQYIIFCYLGLGSTAKEISGIPGRFCSEKTIWTHFKNIRGKFAGVKDLYELRVIATRFLVYKEQHHLVEKPLPQEPRVRTYRTLVGI